MGSLGYQFLCYVAEEATPVNDYFDLEVAFASCSPFNPSDNCGNFLHYMF
jgi:hypothetical protein